MSCHAVRGLFGGLGALLIGAALPALAHAEGEGVWETHASLNLARYDAAVGEIGGLLVVAGGRHADVLDSVELYDFDRDRWRAGARLPQPRYGAAAIQCKDRLYVLGGSDGCCTFDGSVFVYDPDHDSWSSGPTMPTELIHHAAVEHGGRIYVFGGETYPLSDRTFVFDPGDSTWSERGPMPMPRYGHRAVSLGGFLYVIGGHGSEAFSYLARVDRYDPGADSWSSVAPLPSARRFVAAAAVGNRIHVFGGSTEYVGALSDHLIYDPLRDAWFATDPMPAPRTLFSATVRAGRILLPAGWHDSLPSNHFDSFLPERVPGVDAYCFCADGDPCGNPDGDGGCRHSGGTGALLTATGSASVAADDLVLRWIRVPPFPERSRLPRSRPNTPRLRRRPALRQRRSRGRVPLSRAPQRRGGDLRRGSGHRRGDLGVFLLLAGARERLALPGLVP